MSVQWPKYVLCMDDLAGILEVAQDITLIGSFGGFGGSFFHAHRSEEAAKAYASLHKFKSGVTLFRVKLEAIVHIGPDGKEYPP